MLFSKILALTSFLLFFILFVTISNSQNIPEVYVIGDKPMKIKMTVTNVGTQRQKDWLVGFDLYKVSGSAKISNTEIMIRYPPSRGMSSHCYYYDSNENNPNEKTRSPIPLELCSCENTLWGYLEPRNNMVVTCELQPLLWQSRLKYTYGNEKINLAVMETEEGMDLDNIYGWGWFSDAFVKRDVSMNIYTQKGPRADVEAENRITDCNSPGEFGVKVTNTGDTDLTGEVIDELWIDEDGNLITSSASDRHKICTKSFSATITKDNSWNPTWTMSESGVCDSGNQGLKMQINGRSPFYFHKITVKDSQGNIAGIAPKVDAPFEEQFPGTFTCKGTNTNSLLLNCQVDDYKINGRNVYCYTYADIYDSNNAYIGTYPVPGNYPLREGQDYKIYAYPIYFHGSITEFSHFYDQLCALEGSPPYTIDSADNPHNFNMYSQDKRITLFYKQSTFIDLSYDGYNINGNLRDEDGSVLSSYRMDPTCKGPSTEVTNNLDVELFYEKDGAWYSIGTTPATDGRFSYGWECVPGMDKIKAVYNPNWWSYEPASSEIPYSCDLDVKSVRIYKGSEAGCTATNNEDGTWSITGVCSEFKNCGDKIRVDVLVKNEGSLSYTEASVKLSVLEINEEDGTEKKREDLSPIGEPISSFFSGAQQTLTYEIPTSNFADMEEGRHLGFSLDVNGKTFGGNSIEFPAPKGDQLPKIDNSNIYQINEFPHMDFSCDGVCKVGEPCSCTVKYTHDENEPGKVHLHWSSRQASVSLPTSCKHGIEFGDLEIAECDVNNGDVVEAVFKPEDAARGDFLYVYARVRDSSKDNLIPGSDVCLFSLDPNPDPDRYTDCDEIDRWDDTDSIDCKTTEIRIPVGRTIQTDLVINDIFSTDGKIMYEITNKENAAAFPPSSSGLYINDQFVTTHADGVIMAGENKQFVFSGVDWKSYCPNPSDYVNVTICADFFDDVIEINEGNNCNDKSLQCGESKPEICDNFVDDDNDDYVDCEDIACRGALTPVGRCCMEASDCTATDSDYGNNPPEKGICTPYDCQSNICRAGTQTIDSCESDNRLREYYPNPSQPNSCTYDSVGCPEGSRCYDGACIPKEEHPEICDNFIDDDGDGAIDCVDTDCWGSTGGLGLTCCGGASQDASNWYCNAVDTDGGYDPSETGTCVPYECVSNTCRANLNGLRNDKCDGSAYVYEYYPDPSYSYSCLESRVICPSGICLDGRCMGCTGQVELSLIPDEVYKGGEFTFYASGLLGCNGKIIHFKEGSCDATTDKASCEIQSDGNGCMRDDIAPSEVGMYTYFACVDINNNGIISLDEPKDSADLTVTEVCEHQLSINPKDQTVTGRLSNPWTVVATDNSVSSCKTPIRYNITNSTSGDCTSRTYVSDGFNIETIKGSNNFNVYVETTGARPCELTLNVISPKGYIVDTGYYKVCGPEVCDDGIDNDCDDKIDCADTENCAGRSGPGGVQCCNGPCSASDTDGNDIYTKGICTQYSCLSYQCAFASMLMDECIDASTVKEYEASGSSCNFNQPTCPSDHYCYDGKCVPISCTGTISLTLDKNTAYQNDRINAMTDGLSGCAGRNVFFAEGSCTGTSIGRCDVNDGGCSIEFNAPNVGVHTYYACINKNKESGDSDFNDPGEQATAMLEVIERPPVHYSLQIDPSQKVYKDNINNQQTWAVRAEDSSTDAPDSINYLVIENKPFCGSGTGVTPNPFQVQRGTRTENAFRATAVRGTQPCELSIRIIAPDGTEVATGNYKVCMQTESPNNCNDGVDNDCDGYTDCGDDDCFGTSITKDGTQTWCCGGSNPDQHCGGSNKCADTALNPLGGGKCTDWYCDVNEYVCKSNTYTDTCGGDADYPSVTYYECSGSQCEANTNANYRDSCSGTDNSCSATDWDCTTQGNGAGMLVQDKTYQQGGTQTCVNSNNAARHWACDATDGGVVDSCMSDDTDCTAIGRCNCNPSTGDCVGCSSNQICQNYQCIQPDCKETCESFGYLPATGTCGDSCSIDKVDVSNIQGIKNPCPVISPSLSKCCCTFPCNITAPPFWCWFDGCGYENECDYTYGSLKPLYKGLITRSTNFYGTFSEEIFKVFCPKKRSIDVTMTPLSSEADFDLYVKWQALGEWTGQLLSEDCSPPDTDKPGNTYERCQRSNILETPSNEKTLIAIGAGNVIPANAQYNLEVKCTP